VEICDLRIKSRACGPPTAIFAIRADNLGTRAYSRLRCLHFSMLHHTCITFTQTDRISYSSLAFIQTAYRISRIYVKSVVLCFRNSSSIPTLKRQLLHARSNLKGRKLLKRPWASMWRARHLHTLLNLFVLHNVHRGKTKEQLIHARLIRAAGHCRSPRPLEGNSTASEPPCDNNSMSEPLVRVLYQCPSTLVTPY
jgi:hypothetical protein